MRSLKESILDSDSKIKNEAYLDTRKALANKILNRLRHKIDDKKRDLYGRELKVGDIVISGAMYNICVVTDLDVPRRENDVVIYDLAAHKDRVASVFELFKLEEPELYLK